MTKTLALCIILFFFSCLYPFLRKTYLKKILDLVGVILIILFYSNNRWSNDYDSYSGVYFEQPELYAEKGYIILVKLIREINGNYNYILFLASIFIVYTMYINLKKKNLFLMCSLYFIYPFILDLNQIRNTIMIFFVINSLNFFNNKKNFFGYILFIIGVTFQKLGFIYIPFIFFFKNKKMKSIYGFSILFYFISFIVCTRLDKIINLLEKFKLLNGITSKLNYYSRSFNYSTLMLWTIIFLFDVLFIKKLMKEKKEQNLELYYKFILYSGSLIPLFCVVAELNRIYRNVFFVKYIIVLSLLEGVKNKNKIFFFSVIFFESVIILLLLYIRGLEIDKTLFSF